MSYSGRSMCIRWKLGWLPGSQPKSCPKHPDNSLSKEHDIQCLDMHRMLQMLITIENFLSLLLNLLLTRKSRSFQSVSSWLLC